VTNFWNFGTIENKTTCLDIVEFKMHRVAQKNWHHFCTLALNLPNIIPIFKIISLSESWENL